ncbi:hypothetical protein [Acrocarpospora sp. B8E8]|uniref:hypothetical protein n=1 Tax=Acrocarpospora sp. B8E8 TaxID=3153572 RepID=UPI00325EBB57
MFGPDPGASGTRTIGPRKSAAARLADPVELVAAQRRELLRRLREAQQAALAEPAGSGAGLLLEGVALRLQADLRWLDACERAWSKADDEIEGG